MSKPRGAAVGRRFALVVAALGLAVAGPVPAPSPAAAAPIAPLAVPSGAAAAPADAQIKLRLSVGNLSSPVFMAAPNDGTSRLFIVEKTGRIRIYRNGQLLSKPFLSIPSQVSTGQEQGLLGLAFHPNFIANRKLYVNFTDRAGDTIVREYKACAGTPNVVCLSTARELMKIPQPADNHNGGMLAFGPDGYLYIGTGDGGGGGDPNENGQKLSTRLGKILRIDVNGTTSTAPYRIPPSNPFAGSIPGYDAIWQYGLRNPWRFSFDRLTGDLWIADVGQGKWEEVDRAKRTASGAGRGVNWGWDVMEGTHCYEPPSGCNTSGKELPLLEYDHDAGRCAVTGGYVYRGKKIPDLVGGYLFADYCSGEIWVVDANAPRPATPTRLLDTGMLISGFGEGPAGELYVLDLRGAMYQIVPA
ncbi:MAG TPA: PQQ-dependent sugar dehydrogenase [Candidatus Binatia bacterium]|nr:PQQ-dependent sugar dehydrogenase [Candidatus Binatia bacterium]